MSSQSLEPSNTVVLTDDQVNVLYAGLFLLIEKFEYSDDPGDKEDVATARQTILELDSQVEH